VPGVDNIRPRRGHASIMRRVVPGGQRGPTSSTGKKVHWYCEDCPKVHFCFKALLNPDNHPSYEAGEDVYYTCFDIFHTAGFELPACHRNNHNQHAEYRSAVVVEGAEVRTVCWRVGNN
jgi:hypothetical protein